MTGQPWGRTGRVTLRASPVVADVRVDDVRVGFISRPRDGARYSAVLSQTWQVGAFPTLDHAVMWVLRYTRPDAWREERPAVYQVWRDVLGNSPGESWHVGSRDPWDDTGASSFATWRGAMASAERHARAQYAARAAR